MWTVIKLSCSAIMIVVLSGCSEDSKGQEFRQERLSGMGLASASGLVEPLSTISSSAVGLAMDRIFDAGHKTEQSSIIHDQCGRSCLIGLMRKPALQTARKL